MQRERPTRSFVEIAFRIPELAARTAERFAPLLLVAVSALYLVGTCGRASQKLFWHDELFTLYISRLPHLRDVVAALVAGSDGTPPLFYAVTRASVALFGDGLIGLRLPSILGFLAAMLCLNLFVARRYGRVYGLLASMLLVSTNAYIYAYEARAYGMVIGCAGGALISWQAAAAGRRRTLTLPTLFICLAAAISLHYYAILLLVPLAVGEIARWWERRVSDWRMWLTLVASLTPLIVLSPLIRTAMSVATGRFSQVSAQIIAEQYGNVLAPLAIPGIVIMMLVVAVGVIAMPRGSVEPAVDTLAPAYEWLAMITLAGLPLLGAVIGKFVTGAFVPRYALSWVLGFSVLAAYSAAALSRSSRIVSTIAMAGFAVWVSAKELSSARLLTVAHPTLAATNAAVLAQRNGGDPIAVTHSHIYLPLVEYAPRAIASRLVMLTQPSRLDAQLGGPSGEAGLYGLAAWVPLKIQDFDVFVHAHRQFLLYGPPMWLAPELRAAGAHLELAGEDDVSAPLAMSAPSCVYLYRVTFD
jgi:hypothetical protein